MSALVYKRTYDCHYCNLGFLKPKNQKPIGKLGTTVASNSFNEFTRELREHSNYSTGRNLATSLIELGIETFIALIEFGAGKLFEWIARFIPYVGFLIGIIAGWLISYLLSKFFNSRRVARITSKFKASVKNIKISLANWVKYAVKSLNA